MKVSVKLPIDDFRMELSDILDFWLKFSPDQLNGGFQGGISNDNIINPDAPKGAVLNARILWTFSAASRLTGELSYLLIAERAFNFLRKKFTDKKHGGLFWSLDAAGNPLSRRKQIYAQAFGIYGYLEYFQASGDHAALDEALKLFEKIEAYAHDKLNGGYTEAFAEDWCHLEDVRLSGKDANEPKSMNTMLHILEAYTILAKVDPQNESVRSRVRELLSLFQNRIVDPKTGHMRLFFGMDWEVKSTIISYGHDIEASWLLWEAWEAAGIPEDEVELKQLVLKMAESTIEGMDNDGGIWYEKDSKNNHWIYEKHWWPQAEAMVGFYNAWKLSGDSKWLEQVKRVWSFIDQYIIDHQNGEWFWGVDGEGIPLNGEDKAGFWKCPYHNSRALIELIRRHEK